MEQKDTIFNNILIANFMGLAHSTDIQIDEYEMAGLKYHTSWGWLMPVVEKIESMGYEVIIRGKQCEVKYIDDAIYGVDSNDKLKSTYETVVDVISIINTQTNN